MITPGVTLTAYPPHVAPGGSATLTWHTTNAETVSMDNGIGALQGESGSRAVAPTPPCPPLTP